MMPNRELSTWRSLFTILTVCRNIKYSVFPPLFLFVACNDVFVAKKVSPPFVNIHRFEFESRFLGHGNAGSAQLVTKISGVEIPKSVVVKRSPISTMLFFLQFRSESALSYKLCVLSWHILLFLIFDRRSAHDNLLGSYAWGKIGEYGYIVMEFCDGGNLGDLSLKKMTVEQQKCANGAMFRGLRHLHGEGYAHKDLVVCFVVSKFVQTKNRACLCVLA